jgi:hypothetical protein
MPCQSVRLTKGVPGRGIAGRSRLQDLLVRDEADVMGCLACMRRALLAASVLAAASLGGQATVPLPPANIRITYTEQILEIAWDSVPSAIGYNLYTSPVRNAPPAQRRKVNSRLITSGTRFTYIWDVLGHRRTRAVKGFEHHLCLTSVVEDSGAKVESACSEEFDNCYYDGFRGLDSPDKITRVLVAKQESPFLPVAARPCKKKDFLRFMSSTGKQLHALVAKAFDPHEVGACSPVTTILVRLLYESGVYAYKVEGSFIKEYHAFAIVNIDNVEYVLDFTADQFVPNVTPVLFPRDLSHLNEHGRLSRTGMPVYTVARVYSPVQVALSTRKSTDVYWEIYNTLSVKKEMKRDTTVVEPVPAAPVPDTATEDEPEPPAGQPPAR